MPKENHMSADRVLSNLEDNGYMKGLSCVGPSSGPFGMFQHPITVYQNRGQCQVYKHELEAILDSSAIPLKAKPPLDQVAKSSTQAGLCVFWRGHHDPRAESAPCQEADAVLSKARNRFRQNYPY